MKEFCKETTRSNVLKAMSGISKPSEKTKTQGRSTSYHGIPFDDYYLVFLMMVDLLKYEYLGPAEKVSYIIPFDFEGVRCSVAHQKFGMRLWCGEEQDGEAIYKVIRKGIKAAKPYFLWRAEKASTSSNLNLESKCPQLWEKYEFLREQSVKLIEQFERDKDKAVIESGESDLGFKFTSTSYPAYEFRKQGRWMHEAAVDAFFAWCEQALVHIAILQGTLTNGKQIVDVLKGEFGKKCKLVLDLTLPEEKVAYDDIVSLRNELRNYVAHGSFGKDGSAFSFHTATGAVPLKVLDGKKISEFSFGSADAREWESDYKRIESFLETLWGNGRGPAQQFLETGFSSVLTYAVDGTYDKAMQDEETMESFLIYLGRMIDDAANMDF